MNTKRFKLIMPDGSTGFFNDTILLPIKYYRKLNNSFSCLVDAEGIIFFSSKGSKTDGCEDGDFERPCMKSCIDLISLRSLSVAKAVLALSCELQNCDAITERAEKYYLPLGKEWYNSVKGE